MTKQELLARFLRLHRRRPGKLFYASDRTGRDIARELRQVSVCGDLESVEELFRRWKRGLTAFRLYSIEVRPLHPAVTP